MTMQAVMVNLEAYRPLQHRHKWLMQVLVSYSDRKGRCWPSLRTIARHAGQSLAWVSENLKEMASLGYFQRWRKAGAYVYDIAQRFLPWSARQESAGADSSKPRAQRPGYPRDQQAYQQLGVRRGEPKENQETDSLAKAKGDSGRCAPSDPPPPTEEEKARVTALVAEATETLRGKAPKRIHDPIAYEEARRRGRFVNMCRGLACWLAQAWAPGEERWQAEAALNQGLEAGSREQTPAEALEVINRLAELRERQLG